MAGVIIRAALPAIGLALGIFGPAVAAPPPQACVLLSKAMATQILGPSAGSAEAPPAQPPMTDCRYQNAAAEWVDVMTGPWTAMKQDVAGLKSIGGLGDEAYFQFITTLYVRKGNNGMEISVSEPGNSSGAAAEAVFTREREKAKDAARALLPKL